MSRSTQFDALRYFNNKRAAGYNQRIRWIIPAYDALHAMAHSLLRTILPEHAHLLVVGAGTGMEIITYADANPQWVFTAVEPSPDMMALCRANIAASGLTERVHFHEGFADELPNDSIYDAATLILVSHFIEEPKKQPLYQAISARLRQDAPFILVDLHGEPGSPQFEALTRAWQEFYAQSGISQEELERTFRHIEKDMSFISANHLFQMLAESGFAEITPFYRAYLFGGWVSRKI